MAADRTEAAKPGPAEKGAPEAPAAAAAPAASGGFKTWLPLLANVLLMPVLAYFTTTLLLAPKLKPEHPSAAPAEAHAKTESASGHGEAGSAGGKVKSSVPLGGKILVNIAGTMGTRYLLANLTLVGIQPSLRESVEKNDAELRDVAAGVLSTKTIADLEKPGSRNLIRTELISVFNSVLGDGAITELYLTEFAIQ
jgi:flagellar FliL protein